MNDKPAASARKVRPGLGRGLSALLGDVDREEPIEGGAPPAGIRMLPVSALAPHPGQPRRHFDEEAIAELANSIAQRGLIQPIVVRPHGKDFQIVAGERRWRAAQRARLHNVPVIVRELSDAETLEIALVENIQRQDLNAIEEADAYRKLIEEFGHTQEALARLVAKSRSHIANLLRLLDLPVQVQKMVIEDELQMGHARALIGAPDPLALAQRVRDKQLTVRETERLVRQARSGKKDRKTEGNGGSGDTGQDADLQALEQQLGDVLGLHVRISHSDKGGALTINYSTLDQLDMVCQRLSGDGF
ncbi:ParB/RepB/Spo0J family partition protein [Stakelama sediminis]|uniref:ParB family chromosome partitioning protein n=1 Tax=Stakelama sediminis TaxID=463200 RepID=A0A840Z208_9SPHN|nr:ParB/RepB/Spo0J family partition protein [Stakelama sediminis]MBB5719829.1 ParB family chromosome partitioning protein [Stakelama sediminis]